MEAKALAPAVLGRHLDGRGDRAAARGGPGRDFVRALVLARPAWLTDAAPANMRPYAEVGELLALYPRQEALARFEQSETASRLRRGRAGQSRLAPGFFSRAPQEATAELLLRISRDGPGVREADVANLRLPVLVIGHERDEAHPLAYAEWLAERIPGARLATITPKAVSRSRYVEDFRAAVRDFLDTLARPFD